MAVRIDTISQTRLVSPLINERSKNLFKGNEYNRFTLCEKIIRIQHILCDMNVRKIATTYLSNPP